MTATAGFAAGSMGSVIRASAPANRALDGDPSPARVATWGLAVAIAYYLGAQIGMALTPAWQHVSTLWPPNAILLGALILAPTRYWPVMLAAAFPAHLFVELGSGVPLPMVMCWFVSNSLEAVIGAGLLRRASGNTFRFDGVEQVGLFWAAAVFLAPFLSSFVDAGFVKLNHWGIQPYWAVFRVRLLSNILANLIIVPAILSCAEQVGRRTRTLRPGRVLEATALVSPLIGVCVVIFAGRSLPAALTPALFFAPLPLLLWAALRFGIGGTSICLLSLALISVWGAIHGRGPFVSDNLQRNVSSLQLFLVATYVPLFVLASVIGERQRAVGEVVRSRQYLQIALSAARMGVWEWDATTRRISLSAESRTLLHLPPEMETISYGRLLRAIQHPHDRQRVHVATAAALEDGAACDVEFRFAGRHREERWIHVRGTALRSAGMVRMVGVAADVTERRRSEHQIIIQQRELAHLGRVSTIGELSGALAHELSQPLAAILANARSAQHMLDGSKTDRRGLRAILEDIVADDLRANAVVQRVRGMIRKGVNGRNSVIANDVITEVLDLAHRDLVQRSVSVTTRFAPYLPPVSADRVQLQQVLLNLLVNACDAVASNPPAERTVAITTMEEEHSVCVAVSDRGHGITTAAVDEVFEPFVTSKKHGLGLGLTICRSIVQAHGGRIWATNNIDGGATFFLSIPRG